MMKSSNREFQLNNHTINNLKRFVKSPYFVNPPKKLFTSSEEYKNNIIAKNPTLFHGMERAKDFWPEYARLKKMGYKLKF